MKLKSTYSKEQAALKAGMDRKTARKYLKSQQLPSDLKKPRTFRTRKDPFAEVWPTCEAMLESAPGLEAKTLLEWLIESTPDSQPQRFHNGLLRTLQRRIRVWRAEKGPDKAVIFPQTLLPGRQSQSDCTWMNELQITIAGQPFPHLLFHFMLPYSRWETVSICFSESFASLTAGYSAAVWELGAVAGEHRTDNLTAATHQFGNDRAFNASWEEFLSHHRVKPSRNNPGASHENGSVEKSHDLFKKAVNQQLLLRGTRDFACREDYEDFLKQLLVRRNRGRLERLKEEMPFLKLLPERRWETVETLPVRVSPASTITVYGGIYSVPSRLISYVLHVDIHQQHLEVRYGRKVLQTMPRLAKDQGVAINYRHIISYLIRKPGAFAQYQYRESLFPRLIFRQAYDALMKANPRSGHKHYLQVLQMAAIGSENDVVLALEMLMSENQPPLPEVLKSLLDGRKTAVPEVQVTRPSLGSYDHLLSFALNAKQEGCYGAH